MSSIFWPAWRYGPNNAAAIFTKEGEVPEGWADHPTKVAEPDTAKPAAKTAAKPAAAPAEKPAAAPADAAPADAAPADAAPADAAPAEKPAAAPADKPADKPDAATLDAHGWPWDAEKHAASKSKTRAGLWRMKVGVSRPAAINLDL